MLKNVKDHKNQLSLFLTSSRKNSNQIATKSVSYCKFQLVTSWVKAKNRLVFKNIYEKRKQIQILAVYNFYFYFNLAFTMTPTLTLENASCSAALLNVLEWIVWTDLLFKRLEKKRRQRVFYAAITYVLVVYKKLMWIPACRE
jgi:hypothetical protein